MSSGIISFVSNRHGKFYGSLAALHGDGTPPTIAIMGPFSTEAEAEKWANKWVRLNGKRMKRGGNVAMPDMKTVPKDVRAYITNDLTNAIAQHANNIGALPNVPFGRVIQ